MYVAPETVVKICKGVPFDGTYTDTVLFTDLIAQQNYFNQPNVLKYTLQKQSFVRGERGTIKVEISEANLWDCNYLCYQNSSFGSKWFYAFIDKIEYVNNATTIIYFSLDYMQTFMFEYEIRESFVEREHVIDDTLGANTVAEPISTGDADVNISDNYYFNDWDVIISYTPGFMSTVNRWMTDFFKDIRDNEETWEVLRKTASSLYDFFYTHWTPAYGGSFINNIYTGNQYVNFHVTGDKSALANQINAAILGITAGGNKITSVCQVPHEFVERSSSFSPIHPQISSDVLSPPSTFYYISKAGGYTPKNNKVKTSPYAYLRVSNNQGQQIDLGYERMKFGGSQAGIYGCYGNVCECSLEFNGYGSGGLAYTRLATLSISNFPKCDWNDGGVASTLIGTINKTTQFSAQAVRMMNNAVPPVMKQPSHDASKKGGTSNLSYVDTTATRLNQQKADFYTKQGIENEVAVLATGLSNSMMSGSSLASSPTLGSVDVSFHRLGFEFYQMCICGEQAQIVDEFFERYGYATNLVKIPNLNTRPHWNYVKTRNCTLRGNCPQDAIEVLKSIYNNGITFWKVPSEVGNYSLNNH